MGRKRPASRRKQRAARRSTIWVGGRGAPPLYVTGEGEPYRPVLLAWMELPEGLIVGHRLVAPDERETDLGQLLLESMEAPLVGPPRRPDRIRVAEPDLARQVRAALGDEIPVGIAATPELDELFHSMIEHLPDRDEEPPRTPARIESVGRNQPCPCGSGKKYKKCHLQTDQAQRGVESKRAATRRRVASVDDRLEHFAMSNFGYEWLRFGDDFADDENSDDLAQAWGLYHHAVRGQTVLDWFLEEGERLPAAERAWLMAQKRAWLSVWEVRDVKPGETVTLADLLSHEVREVQEVEASRILLARDAILTRVIDCDGESILSGTHARVLSPLDAAEVVRRARSRLRRRRAVPVERLRDAAFGRYLIRRWEEAVENAEARSATPLALQNTDGDPLLLTTDHFDVSPGAEGLLRARLAAMPGVLAPRPGDASPEYAFVRSRDDTVIGRAAFVVGRLVVETNSIDRADALRTRIERTCGALLLHLAREHADPLSSAAPPPTQPRDAALDSPEADELVRGFKERHYADWLDHPLPALGGATPREAVRTRDGRSQVDALLKEFENAEQSLAASSRVDFTVLRRELSLDP